MFLTSIDYNKDPDADSAFYYNAYPDLGSKKDADPDLDCVLFLQYSWIRSQESKSMRIRILNTAVRLIEAQQTRFQKASNVHFILNLLCWTWKKILIFYFNTKGPIRMKLILFGTVPVCTGFNSTLPQNKL